MTYIIKYEFKTREEAVKFLSDQNQQPQTIPYKLSLGQ